MIAGGLLDRIAAKFEPVFQRISQRFAAEIGQHARDIAAEWMPAILFLVLVALILWALRTK